MPTPSRRALLGAATLTMLGVTGCTVSDPTITGRGGRVTSAAPGSSAGPDPAMVAAATDESAALVHVSAVGATGVAWPVPPSFAAWTKAVAGMHRAHQRVFAQADPLGGTAADPTPAFTVPVPSVPLPATQHAAEQATVEAETRLAQAHRARAAQATDPATALLFASASVAARAHRWLGTVAPVEGRVVPAPVTVGTPLEARQVLLSQLDATIFGYESGLGQMPSADARRKVAVARLEVVRSDRDAVAAALVSASATPLPALAGYDLPGTIGTPDQIAEVWGRLESTVLDARARLAAALLPAERPDALQQLDAQVDAVTRWRVPLTYWPGWV